MTDGAMLRADDASWQEGARNITSVMECPPILAASLSRLGLQ